MKNHIRCAECRYVRRDEAASDKRWTAYECGCGESEYFKALLNVSPRGEKQDYISWGGCEDGVTRPSGARRDGV